FVQCPSQALNRDTRECKRVSRRSIRLARLTDTRTPGQLDCRRSCPQRRLPTRSRFLHVGSRMITSFAMAVCGRRTAVEQGGTHSERPAQTHSAELHDSEAECRRLLAEQPNRADLLGQLAALLHRTGRTAEAIAALDRAIILDPRCPNYPHALGMLY